MRLASRFVLLWTLLALLALSGACATTISPERRQFMSDCTAQCDTGREPPQIGPMGRPANQHDTRTDCDKRCQ
jgi:hypothetical protein